MGLSLPADARGLFGFISPERLLRPTAIQERTLESTEDFVFGESDRSLVRKA